MKRFALSLCLVVLLGSFAVAQELPPPGGSSAIKSNKDKASYGIGLNIGRSIKSEGFDLNIDMVVQGIKDSLSDQKSQVSEEELRAALAAVEQEMVAVQAQRRKEQGEKNKKEGAAFLAANKNKPGVKTTESGLQYKVLKSGTGAKPKVTDKVTTHYRGTLIDGTEFDSSIARGEPATFPVSGVIRGWTEALQLMKVGDKWQLFIPSELAYGPRGAGGEIGPDAVLIFDIELLGIEPQ